MPSVTTKLYVGFGVLLALLLALGGLVAYDISGVHSRLDQLSRHDMPALKVTLSLARNFSTEVNEAHLFLARHESWRMWEGRSAGKLVDVGLDSAIANALPRDRGDIRRIRMRMKDLESHIQDAEAKAQLGLGPTSLAGWDVQVTPLAEAINGDIDLLRRRQEDHVFNTGIDVFNQTEHLRIVSQYVVISAIVGALLAIAFLARDIVVPIRRLVKAVGRVAEGDLAVQVEWPTNDEFGKLASDFNQMTNRVADTILQLHKAQVTLEERNKALAQANDTIQKEMELAARIQRGILPSDCNYQDVIVVAAMEAASDIGGDFYDILPDRPGPGTLAIAIGDISGKGIAAALMMVFVVTVLREICRQDAIAAEVLEQLNHTVLSRFSPRDEMYATCVFGVLDRRTLRFTYSKAGHEEPIWYHAATGECEMLAAPGLFVGTFSNGFYGNCEIQLELGDRLVFYTDGVVESRSSAGGLFGFMRLCELVQSCGAEGASAMVEAIRQGVCDWTGTSIPTDDITVLVVEIPFV